MHTLRQFMPLLLAFTLGATIMEIRNLREHNADMQVLYQEIADQRVDSEINYYDGYRLGMTEHQASGKCSSHCAPVCLDRR